MDTKKSLKELSKKVLQKFGKIEIYECEMCGAFLTADDYKQYERICAKHWDY